MGATDFDTALRMAAMNGHVLAMREARSMGATHFEAALTAAAEGGHAATMVEACRGLDGARNYQAAADVVEKCTEDTKKKVLAELRILSASCHAETPEGESVGLVEEKKA